MRNLRLREVSYPRDKELPRERQTSRVAIGYGWSPSFFNSVVLGLRQSGGRKRSKNIRRYPEKL